MTSNVKGAAVRAFVHWYGERFGADRVRAIAEAMAPEHRALVDVRAPDLGVLSPSWLPAPAVHAVLDAVTADMSPDERDALAREAAHTVISQTLHGVYKVFFDLMTTPERYRKNAQKLFARYFDCGTMEKTVTGDKAHLSVIRDWPAHHPLLCDLVRYMALYVYGEMGCKDVTVAKVRCVSDGATDCAYTVSWR
jgi:hypothetical protein